MYSEFYGIYFDKMKHQNEATNEMSSGRGLSVTIGGKENLCAGMVNSSRIGYLIKSYNLIYISWHVAMWFGKNNKHKTPAGVFLQAEKGHVKVSTCPFSPHRSLSPPETAIHSQSSHLLCPDVWKGFGSVVTVQDMNTEQSSITFTSLETCRRVTFMVRLLNICCLWDDLCAKSNYFKFFSQIPKVVRQVWDNAERFYIWRPIFPNKCQKNI